MREGVVERAALAQRLRQRLDVLRRGEDDPRQRREEAVVRALAEALHDRREVREQLRAP